MPLYCVFLCWNQRRFLFLSTSRLSALWDYTPCHNVNKNKHGVTSGLSERFPVSVLLAVRQRYGARWRTPILEVCDACDQARYLEKLNCASGMDHSGFVWSVQSLDVSKMSRVVSQTVVARAAHLLHEQLESTLEKHLKPINLWKHIVIFLEAR